MFIFFVIICITYASALYSADGEVLGYPSYRPKEPVRITTYNTYYNAITISEQLLKDEIRAATIPVIRERMRAARAAVGPQRQGRACRIATFQFNRTFHATAQDLVSRTVFEAAHKFESDPNFKAQPVARDTPVSYEVEMATQRHIDRYASYAWASDSDKKTINITVSISDFQFIEQVIADIRQEDGIPEDEAEHTNKVARPATLLGNLWSYVCTIL
jgi:hypothetical protein